MSKLFSKSNQIFLLVLSAFFILFLAGIIILPFGQIGMTLFMLTALVGAVGMVGGLVLSLGLTLILFFLIGSVLFWTSFTGSVTFVMELPLSYLLVWMTVLLALPITTGKISLLVKELNKENNSLREQIRTLVAIDPITGFDNEDRMLMELELEFSRSKRYGHTFSLILIKLNHLSEFRRLYGEQELTLLLQYLSNNIYQSMRASDYKFRPEVDMLALLLTDTSLKDIRIIIEKLKSNIRVFQLSNKKYITLSIDYGYIEFDKEMDGHLDLYEQAKEQVSTYVS